MKKLLFVLAFAFIGLHSTSQVMTLMVNVSPDSITSSFPSSMPLFVITDPIGIETPVYPGNSGNINSGAMGLLVLEINNIINNGYKLLHVFPGTSRMDDSGFTIQLNPNSILYQNEPSLSGSTITTFTGLKPGTIFLFSIPWTVSGLEEVIVNSTTTMSFLISPNPANTFVDITLDYSFKGESEVVFISEGGYISHKQSIGNISKNEKYNIDISKIPAGKYLVTIVNGKTYTTPQKLIIL